MEEGVWGQFMRSWDQSTCAGVQGGGKGNWHIVGYHFAYSINYS